LSGSPEIASIDVTTFHPHAARVLAIIESCRGLVPDDRLEADADLACNGEWGVALEVLCEQLLDAGVVLDDVTRRRIEELGTALQLRSGYWERLPRSPS
jgi:hypothetical protein